jgi:hypothetical protein
MAGPLQMLEAKYLHGEITQEQAVAGGVPLKALKDIARAYDIGGNRPSAERNVIDALYAANAAEATRGEQQQSVREQGEMERLGLIRQGLHQGLVADIFHGKISSASDALQSLGYAVSKEEYTAAQFNEDETKTLVSAAQARQAAAADMGKAGTPDEKAAAKKRYDEAMDQIHSLQLIDSDESTRKALGEGTDSLTPVPTSMFGPSADAAGASAAPNATDSKPAAGKPAAQAEPQKLDASMVATINVTVNGQEIPKTEYTAQINQSSGFRNVTLNGDPGKSGKP